MFLSYCLYSFSPGEYEYDRLQREIRGPSSTVPVTKYQEIYETPDHEMVFVDSKSYPDQDLDQDLGYDTLVEPSTPIKDSAEQSAQIEEVQETLVQTLPTVTPQLHYEEPPVESSIGQVELKEFRKNLFVKVFVKVYKLEDSFPQLFRMLRILFSNPDENIGTKEELTELSLRKKRNAIQSQDPITRSKMYLEAVLYFIITAKTCQKTHPAYAAVTYADTIRMVKYFIKLLRCSNSNADSLSQTVCKAMLRAIGLNLIAIMAQEIYRLKSTSLDASKLGIVSSSSCESFANSKTAGYCSMEKAEKYWDSFMETVSFIYFSLM